MFNCLEIYRFYYKRFDFVWVTKQIKIPEYLSVRKEKVYFNEDINVIERRVARPLPVKRVFTRCYWNGRQCSVTTDIKSGKMKFRRKKNNINIIELSEKKTLLFPMTEKNILTHCLGKSQ